MQQTNSPGSQTLTVTITDGDLLDIEAVCRFFGGTKPLHPATIYRGLGIRYPRPIRVSPNVNRWLRHECELALKALLEKSRQPLPSPKHRLAVRQRGDCKLAPGEGGVSRETSQIPA
jgi:hypothetical protein